MQRDAATLLDIVQAAQLIIEFMQGIDRTAFERDLKTRSAVLHQLMVIGEAVKRLSCELRGRHPEIPWTLIAGMRDRLIHRYDAVDEDEVWKTATVDVPNLLLRVKPLVPGPRRQSD